jgi:TRAP-type C4-dicarboxylate transport system substrate-binding protein
MTAIVLKTAHFPARSFGKVVMRGAIAALVLLWPFAVAAEPIALKLSFFESEKTATYQYGIKPFVDAVNAEGKGLLAIDVYANGALGKAIAEQPQLVLDGTADIAFVVPGQTPYRFPDNELLEMPGLFRDAREGTLAYTRLVAANALRGYQDFFVIGAYTPNPSFIHSRKPTDSLVALKGQKIRANNPIEAEALMRLGVTPTVMPASKLAKAVSQGAIDGVLLSPTGLMQFGVSHIATHHYLLGVGAAPLVLLMSREKFDGLPDAAKTLIRKYSSERAAATWIEFFGGAERMFLKKIKSDSNDTAVEPAPSDLQAAQRVYRSITETWAAKSAHNRDLLKMIEFELTAIRSGE